MNKKDTKLCPGCSLSIPRKNFRQVVMKCKNCGMPTCNYCRVIDTCINCYSEINKVKNINEYSHEKALGVAT